MNYRCLITLIAVLIFLALAGILVWSRGEIAQIMQDLSPQEPTSDQKLQKSRSSHHSERAMRKKQRVECLSAVEAAFQRMLAMPGDHKADRELLDTLAKWAAEDLNGVQRWIEQHDEYLPGTRRWLGHVLKELAKTQPRKALEFGLALNAADLESYAVPPRFLLGMALQHLTAEDAIRVMEMPNHDQDPERILSQSTSSEAYHPDFDFKKLGDYIVRKEHEGERHSWKPGIYPAEWVSSWTRRDPAGAEAFCRAMNDRPVGAALGDEFVAYFSELAKTQTQAEIVEKVMSVISDPSVEFSENNLAYSWIDEEDKRPILLDMAKRLPEATRNRMGEDALLMNILSKTEDSPKILEAAMQLFATAEARDEAMAKVDSRVDPEYVALLRTIQEVIDTQPAHDF